MSEAFEGAGKPLSDAEVAAAASSLGIELPALWAVMSVETRGCGFLADRRPRILFERHIFSQRTRGQFDALAPDLSNPIAGGYGQAGAAQYERLNRAIDLNREAALESTSWGLGQVMGFNAANVGFVDVESMVSAMCESEDRQFGAMAAFVSNNGLALYLRDKDWASFAARYNGPSYQKNGYDKKLATYCARYTVGPLPNLRVRAAQLYLTYLGYSPGTVDGWFGDNTQKALIKFQKAGGQGGTTGELDDDTFAQLENAASR